MDQTTQEQLEQRVQQLENRVRELEKQLLGVQTLMPSLVNTVIAKNPDANGKPMSIALAMQGVM